MNSRIFFSSAISSGVKSSASEGLTTIGAGAICFFPLCEQCSATEPRRKAVRVLAAQYWLGALYVLIRTMQPLRPRAAGSSNAIRRIGVE